MSRADVLDTFYVGRAKFETTSDWLDFVLRSIGLEPADFDERAKRVALLRMVPFVERNYNLVELGPRGNREKPSIPASFALCPTDLWRQGDGGANVRQYGHQSARPCMSIRRRVLR